MVEDETEFRDLISQTLENNGVLGKIKAELRASIFLALEDQDKFLSSQSSPKRQELKDFLQTGEGRQVFGLVRDLFEYFQLDYTLAVLKPETGLLDQSTWNSLEAPGFARSKSSSRPYLASVLALAASASAGGPSASSAAALDAKSSGSNASAGRHYDDDLLPMSASVARGSYAGAASGNSNNNNSSSLGSPTSKRPTAQEPQAQKSFPASSSDSLDPLSSPRRQQQPVRESGASLERPRSRGNNFDDLPSLSAAGGGGGGNARQSPRGGDTSSNSMLSDQLVSNAAGGGGGGFDYGGGGGGDYFDDFEDSIAGGVSSSAGGGALASARSLKSQSQISAGDDGEVEDEEIEVEELPSAADEDPTDVTVDSEISLQADYVEDANRHATGRSQF
ncbi:hypothetical protein BOX15_Mlig006064g1 [Macrostomum lignano]|uniref:FGFR1 oncogene partner (FOP) N-terminal dimerisation domain-containing protein n=2 Tax=Macrostomum lignano TaxID=282301 RepID=A0A267EZY5_9PLAT|nr:hypothetical protein BOX15_Mlig006064g1 [Macrostomum lignano]